MAEGWDCFNSEDEEDEDTSRCNSSEVLHRAYLSLFAMLGSARKEVQFGSFEEMEVDVRPRIHIFGEEEETNFFVGKVTQANFLVHRDVDCIGGIDCVVDLRMRKAQTPLDEELKTQFYHLRNGGLAMFIIEVEPNIDYNETAHVIASSMVNKSLWLTEGAKIQRCSENIGLLFVRKRGVLINESAIRYKSDAAKLIAMERVIAEEVTVTRSSSSIAAGTLSHSDITRATAALDKHGVCIIPAIFDEKYVKDWGRVAIADLEHASKILKTSKEVEDGESVFGGDGLSSNYHELAMREAYRVDIRQGPRMIKHAASTETRRLKDRDGRIPSAQHAALMKVFQSIMNPHPPRSGNETRDDASEKTARPNSCGNFGRWNFEGSGPLNEVPLNIGSVGAVMSMPRSADQAIHADTYHLFENSHLPPHYLNLFLPAALDTTHSIDHDASAPGSRSTVGQTAFIVGSHRMAECERIMEEGSEAARVERVSRIFRPHVVPGDAIIFDTRVLHIGLANDSHRNAIGESGGVWRPVLYTNVTQRWFEDKKNWEKKMLFSPEERAAIDIETSSIQATGGG